MKLTAEQINGMAAMDGKTLRTSYGTTRKPMVVKFERWINGDNDRLYINIISGGGITRDLGNKAGYIDMTTGEILGDNWHKWAQGVRDGVVDEALSA